MSSIPALTHSMLSSSAARSTARAARLAAARDYAAECVQHAELQENLSLEDKILGNLSSIVMEAVDCLRADQPFRSSSLSLLSLELLSYLRQPNKPMLVNFACAFTMLMSELEGVDLTEKNIDLAERGAEPGGGPRSYSNSIPDVPPEAVAVERAASFSSPSTSRRPPVARVPSGSIFPHGDPKDSYPFKDVPLFKEEDVSSQQQRPSVEPIEYGEAEHSRSFGRHLIQDEAAMEESGMTEDGRSESSYPDDASNQSDLLQRMIAGFSAPSTSAANIDANAVARSEAARNQHKNNKGRFESRDDELAATYELPVSAAEIETMPDQSMARLLRSDSLSEEQRAVIRQIRKRARSKISSREYRRRKEAKRLEQSMNSSSHEPPSQ